MSLKFRNVIVVSSHLYKWPFKGGIHYLAELLERRSNKFSFLTIPFSLLTIGSKDGFRTKFLPLLKVWLKNRIKVEKNNWDTIFTLFHPTPRFPLFDNMFIARKFLLLGLPLIKNLCNQHYDVALFEGLGILSEPYINAKLKVYRMSDILEDMHSPKSFILFEEDVIKKVDVVLAVDKKTFDYSIKKKGEKRGIYLLPNGVDFEAYIEPLPEPLEMTHLPHPRIVYVGRFEIVDWELVEFLAKTLKFCTFIFIGGPSPKLSASVPNLILLGYKMPDEVPAYLLHSDVGIMPFRDIQAVRNLQFPLKVYQYLAAGLPIVSVGFGNLKDSENIAFIGNSYNSFAQKIRIAIDKSKDEVYRKNQKLLAESFSWKHVFSKFENILEENYKTNERDFFKYY